MKKRYITGFDGLRAIGLLSVIAYHIYPSIFKGGYLGVALFFVLSGYLITDLLIKEFTSTGSIDFKGFIIRRFKRLYPNMIAVMLLSTLYMTFFQKNLLNGMRGVFWSSLLSVNNWWQISKGASYFEKLMAEAPFQHFYSLSIEGQFYLFWPLIVLLLLKVFGKRRGLIFNIIDVVLLLSFLEMAFLFRPDTDPTRIYYGTDTRLFSILMGAALAFIFPSDQAGKIYLSRRDRIAFNLVSLSTLLLFVTCFIFLDDHRWFTYIGGMWLFSALSAILIAACVHPQLLVNRWLTNPVLSYLGTRSYGMYLWQIPILTFAELKLPNPKSPLSVGIALLILLVVTEITYRLIEVPFRRLTWAQVKSYFQPRPSNRLLPVKWLASLALAGLTVALVGLVLLAPDKTKEGDAIANQLKANQAKMAQNNKAANTDNLTPADPAILQKYGISEETYNKDNQMKLGIVGDSMIAMTYDYLLEVFPNAYYDGAIGRKPSMILETVQETLTNHPEIDHLVVGVGINRNEDSSSLQSQQIEQVMSVVGDRRVYWININIEQSQYFWTGEVNTVLNQAQEQYSNFHIVDWYQASHENEASLLSDDMIHPNDQGSIAYARTIADTLAQE